MKKSLLFIVCTFIVQFTFAQNAATNQQELVQEAIETLETLQSVMNETLDAETTEIIEKAMTEATEETVEVVESEASEMTEILEETAEVTATETSEKVAIVEASEPSEMTEVPAVQATEMTETPTAPTKEDKPKGAHLAMKVVQNSVAGFSPMFFGAFDTNHKFKVTMYSIFWTNTAFGNQAAGSDLLVETGVGLAFPLLNNKLVVNPSIAFGHGKFFSDVPGTRVGEGIIPSLFTAYHDKIFDVEGYIAYYKSLRDTEEINTQDYLLAIFAPGVNVSKRVVLGGFFESLTIRNQEAMRDTEDAKPVNLYNFLGGSVKLKFDNGVAFRFSGGANLKTDIGASSEFYKTSVFIPL